MTPVKNQKGFTIVEVILFLALSGLVFIIGFMGIGSRNAEVQYTDSIRSLESFLEGELSKVYNGVNEISTGDTDDKVMLGKLISFFPDRVETFPFIGDRLTEDQIRDRQGTADPDRWLLYDTNPYYPGSGQQTFRFDWGTTFKNINVGDANSTTPNSFAVMRSPNSNRIFPVSWEVTGAYSFLGNDPEIWNPSNGSLQYSFSPEVYICLEGGNGRYAAISYGGDNQQNAFSALFEPEYSPKNGYSSCGPKA